jgi:hypothetical protein
MAGNGYYDRERAVYLPSSTTTWADLTGNWSSYTSWRYTPLLPLEFTSNVYDANESNYFNVTTDVEYTPIGNITMTLYYGDTLSGGAIVSPSNISWTPGDSVGAVKARYFQLKVSISEDSAGIGLAQLTRMSFNALQEYAVETLTDVATSSLGGTVGARTLNIATGFSQITSLICQPRQSTNTYLASGYVASDDSAGELYVEEGLTPIPHVTVVSKGAAPELKIVDLTTYGQTNVDAVLDIRIEGLRALTADATDGNVRTS